MRRLAIVLVAVASSSAYGQAQESVTLPTGPAPVQALAGFNAEGKLVVKQAVTQFYYIPITTASPDGKSATTRYELQNSPRVMTTTIDKVRAHDVRGNPIAAKRLRKLLREETPVLLATDGKTVDLLHLRLYKEDVIVLMMPIGPAAPPAITNVPASAVPFTPADELPPVPAKIAAAGEGGISVSVFGPLDTRIGLERRFLIEVNNNNQKVTNAKAFVYLPKGVAALAPDVKNQNAITTQIGDIERGKTHKLDLDLRAAKAGAHEIRILVTAEPDVRIELKFFATFAEVPPPGVPAPPPIESK
jgi:hypothetical protein